MWRGRAVRYLLPAAGALILLWLYLPVIVAGFIGFAAVRLLLRDWFRGRPHRGRFLRSTLPRWVEALALLQVARRMPPPARPEDLTPHLHGVYDSTRRAQARPDDEEVPF